MPRDHPGSSSSRFWVALPALTNDTPTFIRTVRSVIASKEANPPQAVPLQLRLPGVTPAPSQLPTVENERLKRAVKYRVYGVPVSQNWPLVT